MTYRTAKAARYRDVVRNDEPPPGDHAVHPTPDLSDPAFWAGDIASRHAGFARLRATVGLPWFAEPPTMAASPWAGSERGFLAVTRHADVCEVTRRAEEFSSAQAFVIQTMPQEAADFFGGLFVRDGPDHQRIRRVVARAFTPTAIGERMATIDEVAAAYVGRMLHRGEFDLVEEVATPYPVEIVCRILGIPTELLADIIGAADVITSIGDPEYLPDGTAPFDGVLAAGMELATLITDQLEARRRHPADDLLTALVVSSDDDVLTDAEATAFVHSLLVAGSDTTRHTLSFAVDFLGARPDVLAAWRADPALTPTAVDELVRWAAPVNWSRRTATVDTVVGGTPVEAGDKLVLVYGAANFDETAFDRPECFDLARSPNPHVSFGSPGIHFCLGAHLARRELAALLTTLYAAGQVTVTGPAVRLTSTTFMNGLKHLPCRIG